MFTLRVHENAEIDLDAIAERYPDDADFIVAFLQELEGDQDLLDRLTQHGYNMRDGDWAESFNVSVWVEQQDLGRNLWRLKLWDDEVRGYRIIYAFQPKAKTYIVLGVIHKSKFKDYDPDHPFSRRIISDYEAL